jgi:hypothetical protein
MPLLRNVMEEVATHMELVVKELAWGSLQNLSSNLDEAVVHPTVEVSMA